MSDRYSIDSHKLMLHPERVAAWMRGEDIYPIYMESSPSGLCNHRCTFCALDFMEYQSRFLDTAIFKERISELGRLGLKSMMFGGEGEPFLHRDMAEITEHTHASGIAASFTTNAVLLTPERAERVLPATKWIKVSINAGTAEAYAKIHRTKEADFSRVIDNMREAAAIKSKESHTCTLGMQILLLPQNKDTVVQLARIAREIGMDYLVVKPYSQHPMSRTQEYSEVSYDDAERLQEELSGISGDGFNVIFRSRTMKKWDEADKPYDKCLALPFWSYIDSGGNVWGCSVYLSDNRFLYGNIYESTFEQIWHSQKRRDSMKMVEQELDARGCRVNCRMDEINRYLHRLRSPQEHDSFI